MNIGLRFVLNNGSFLDVVLPIPTANAIIERWAKRDYHVKDEKIISGPCLTGNSWAVDRDSIVAIHTATVQQNQNGSQLPVRTKSLLSGNC